MTRKKVLPIILMISIVSFFVFGCSKLKEDTYKTNSVAGITREAQKETCEMALVTDLGTLKDNSFNQAIGEGMKQYADEHRISYKYYQPEEGTTDAYVETIDLAVEDGAKIVICPGYLFENPVYIVQDKYPDVYFILLDGKPHNAAYSVSRIEKNVLAILFREEQAGFLAGYAAVKDGNTRLGFMGGMAVPAVIRYGYGFVQGADLAANELGIDIEIMYTYTGSFIANKEIQSLSGFWYQNGTEVIFACGGALGVSVMAAAEETDAKVIGVDIDQSTSSDRVITSAMKMLTKTVYSAIESYYQDSFQGGTVQKVSAENNGIGLPMETSRFDTFSQTDYEEVYAKLVSGEIRIDNRTDDSTTADLILNSTKIKYIE